MFHNRLEIFLKELKWCLWDITETTNSPFNFQVLEHLELGTQGSRGLFIVYIRCLFEEFPKLLESRIQYSFYLVVHWYFKILNVNFSYLCLWLNKNSKFTYYFKQIFRGHEWEVLRINTFFHARRNFQMRKLIEKHFKNIIQNFLWSTFGIWVGQKNSNSSVICNAHLLSDLHKNWANSLFFYYCS